MKDQYILDFVNISKTYSNGFEAIKNFNLCIKPGEFVTLLGPSGCGKTTLLKMIGGFEFPTSGKILYYGIDIKNLPISERPTSTVFQDYALFPNMTVYQNIEYGLKFVYVNNTNSTVNEKQADKIYNESLTKANVKLKDIEKRKKNIQKELAKCDREYENHKDWLQYKKMRLNSFNSYIDDLKKELYKKYGDDFVSKQSFGNLLKNKLNVFLLKLHISNFRFSVSTKQMNEIEKQINKIVKIYSAKCLVDKKYDKLVSKYNDLDYDVSYWQNYPNLQKEKFIKKTSSRRLNKQEINEKINNVINLVGLNGKENLFPHELSGGMQQRVALARSIVIEPNIILLDEPLSALDAKVRAEMQKELKRLHNELKITFILVSHDQEEALTLSDKIVVMNKGEIKQIGTSTQIYDYPANKWVANFIGRANFFDGKFFKNKIVKFIGLEQKVEDYYKFKNNQNVEIMIRPEDIDIVKKNKGFINAVVESIIYKGMMWDIICKYESYQIKVEGINKIEVGSTIGLKWDVEDIHVIAKEHSYV